MPTIEDYAPLAPFALEELVGAANAILRDRPSLQIQPRTVRYYISTGLLPSPSGGPKYARYGVEHLRRLVAIRQWLDQGKSLEQASEMILRGEHGGERETHSRKQIARAQEAPRRPIMGPPARERTVRRLTLSEHSVLEIDAQADFLVELETAAEVIQKEIDRFSDST